MSLTLEFSTAFDDAAIADLSKRNPGYRFERDARGHLIVSPTGSAGGARNAELDGQLWSWSRHGGGGEVFDSSTGFRLPDGSLLSPDGAWIEQRRWDALDETERTGFAPLCPDVVFEIRSASDELREFEAKGGDYARNGARLVVLVDPLERRVTLLRETRVDVITTRQVALDPELPDFVLDLTRLYT